MTAKLSDLDARVLDLISDDYYALWEVCDYIGGLRPKAEKHSLAAECKDWVLKFASEGLIDVFVGNMTGSKFQIVPEKDIVSVLSKPTSWRKQRGKTIVISSTLKGQRLLAKEYPSL